MVVDVGQSDVGHGNALVGGQLLNTIVALEVSLFAVDLDGELVIPLRKSVEVVAAEAAAEEAAGQTGPYKERDAVLAAPGARGLTGRPADADAVAPRRLYLDGEAELGAAGDEGGQPVRGGVLVGLLQAFGAPVGAAVGVDLAGLLCSMEGLDNRAIGSSGSSRCRI